VHGHDLAQRLAAQSAQGLRREPGERRRLQQKLEGLLVEGLGSGAPIRAGREYWAQKRHKLAARKSKQAAK